MLLAALLYVFQVNFCHLTNIVLPCQLSNSDKTNQTTSTAGTCKLSNQRARISGREATEDHQNSTIYGKKNNQNPFLSRFSFDTQPVLHSKHCSYVKLNTVIHIDYISKETSCCTYIFLNSDEHETLPTQLQSFCVCVCVCVCVSTELHT